MSVERVIVLLNKHHQRSEFDCGDPELNLYLRDRAAANAARNLSRSYVITPSATSSEIHGFYTVCLAQIEHYELPETVAAPAYPIPVVRLVRLAIATAYQRQGLGALLLIDACRHSLEIAARAGLLGMVADAKNQDSCLFYQKFGFIPLQDDPLNLFLRLGIIEQLFYE